MVSHNSLDTERGLRLELDIALIWLHKIVCQLGMFWDRFVQPHDQSYKDAFW